MSFQTLVKQIEEVTQTLEAALGSSIPMKCQETSQTSQRFPTANSQRVMGIEGNSGNKK